jgi:NitT/TauT family transport system substrate-binding protein
MTILTKLSKPLGAIALTLALSTGAALSQSADKPVKIGIVTGDIANLTVYVGAAKGFFKEAGLDAQVVQFSSDSAAAQGLTAGAVQLNVGSIGSVINSYATGRDLTAFWSVINMPAYQWYGQTKFNSFKELKGGRIGISSFSSLAHRITEWAVAQNGMDPKKDVQYVAVGGPLERLAALKVGQVDAIPASPPGSYMLEQMGFKLLFDLKEVFPEFQYEVYYARKGTIARDRDLIDRVINAQTRAIQWAKANPEETTQILMNQSGVAKDLYPFYRKTVDAALPYYPEKGGFAEKSIDVFVQFYRDQGQIKDNVSLPAFIDFSFVEAAAKR